MSKLKRRRVPGARYLLYGGLLLALMGALYARARLGDVPPPDLAQLALPELEARAGRDPDNPWVQLELGVRYVQSGRKSSAEAAFQRCVALKPTSVEAHAYLGTMYARQRDYRRAAPMFERAVALDRTLAAAYLELARARYELSAYRQARQAIDRFVALKPDDWDGNYLRGLIYFMDGEYAVAEQSYARCVRLDPKRSAAHLAAGLACMYLPATDENLARALRWFEEARALDPGNTSVNYELGVARFRRHEWEKAVAALRRVIDADPGFTEAYYPLGQALRKLGRDEEGRRYLAGFTRLRTGRKRDAALVMERGAPTAVSH